MASSFDVSRVVVRLGLLPELVRAAAVDGLFDATEHVLGVARDRVPIEEGTLERSGAAYVDENDLLGYVYFDTIYAVVQHEDLTFNHDAGRQAKYLESAFNSEIDAARQLIVHALRRQLFE